MLISASEFDNESQTYVKEKNHYHLRNRFKFSPKILFLIESDAAVFVKDNGEEYDAWNYSEFINYNEFRLDFQEYIDCIADGYRQIVLTVEKLEKLYPSKNFEHIILPAVDMEDPVPLGGSYLIL